MTIEFLGFTWKSASASIHCSPQRIKSIRRLARAIERAHRQRSLTCRQLAAFIGKITATLPALLPAWLRRHALARTLTFGLSPTRDQWDSAVSLRAVLERTGTERNGERAAQPPKFWNGERTAGQFLCTMPFR